MLLQQLVNGIVAGSVYALFALGFNLVLGAMNILNVAQGAVFTWSALVGFYLIKVHGLPFPLALGNTRVARLLLRIQRLLIRISRTLFAFQILAIVRPTPPLSEIIGARGPGADETRAVP